MKDNKNGLKLYNVIFPFWMLIMFPYFWLVIFPANFIIDSLVLILAMLVLKIQDKKDYYKKHIVKIFSFGMISDMIGSLYMLGVMYALSFFEVDFDNYFVTFRKDERRERLKMSLVFAIVTAPYTFLIPLSWMY